MAELLEFQEVEEGDLTSTANTMPILAEGGINGG